MTSRHIAFVLATFLALTFSSCRKEYRCQCSSGWGESISILKANTKHRAETKCSKLNSPPGADDGDYNCHLQ